MTTDPAESELDAPASAASRAPFAAGTLTRVLQNAGWLLAGKGVGAVLSLIYLGLATRYLGEEGFGQFALILGTAQTLASLVTFQTWQLVVRYGMPHLHEGREDGLRDLFSFALTLDFGAALAGCLIAFIGVEAFGDHFGWSAALKREALAFACVLLLSIRSTAVGVLRLYDRFRLGAFADAVTPVARMIGALGALAAGATLTGFLIAWAAAEMATAAAYWFFASRTVGRRLWTWRWGRVRRALASNPGMMRFAFVTNAGTTLNAVARQFSTVAVGFVAGPVAAGHYRLAYQLGQSLAKLSDSFARAAMPELTRAHVGMGTAALRRLFRSAMAFSLLAGVAVIALLLLIGKPAIGLIAGPEYVDAYPLLLLLGAAAALDIGAVSFGPALIATGRAGLELRVRVVTTAVVIALLTLLLPRMGVTGAGIAILTASAVSLVLLGATAWHVVHREERGET